MKFGIELFHKILSEYCISYLHRTQLVLAETLRSHAYVAKYLWGAETFRKDEGKRNVHFVPITIWKYHSALTIERKRMS